MAYHIYTTKGIVLSAYPQKEADRSYLILTEELGLVRAYARGVRAIQSKLRGALEPFSLSAVSLVRGQDTWRVTGATLIERLDTERLGKPFYTSLARAFSLVERLVAGEEAQREVYQIFEAGIMYVVDHAQDVSAELEIVLVLRLLHTLGYVSVEHSDAQFLHAEISPELLAQVREHKKKLVDIINLGLRSSQLV